MTHRRWPIRSLESIPMQATQTQMRLPHNHRNPELRIVHLWRAPLQARQQETPHRRSHSPGPTSHRRPLRHAPRRHFLPTAHTSHGLTKALEARYSTDLSDPEWEILRPLVPEVKPGGRPAIHARREILNALAYWLRAGCAWRLLPHDLPPWQTVYHYWRRWQQEGVWERMLTALRERERVQLGREPGERRRS